MNRGEKEQFESFILSVCLSFRFSCYSALSSSGTKNNSYLTQRQASKPSNTHTHIGKCCLGLVYTVIYRHMTAGYIPVCVCSVKLGSLKVSALFSHQQKTTGSCDPFEHTHKCTRWRSSSSNLDRQANSESIVNANVNVKRVKSRGFQTGYSHSYCCFMLV